MGEMKQDVFTRFSPTFILCRYTGLCSYIIEGPPGFRYVTYSKLYKLISTLIHVVVIFFSYYLCLDSISLLISTPILTMVTALFFLADATRLTTNIFFNKLYSAKTTELLNRLYSMERNLAKLDIHLSHKASKNMLLTCLLAETLISMSLHVVVIGLKMGDIMKYTPRVCLMTYGFYIEQAVGYQFFTFTLLLKTQFQKLNNYMTNRFSKGKDDLDTIKRVVLLHQNLCEMGRDYNGIQSIPLLVCIGFYFCVLLLQLFSFLVTYQSDNWNGILTQFIAVLPSLVKVIAYMQISTSCMREANDIRETVFKLTIEVDDLLLRKELSAFSLQILHEDFHICAGGFFTINYQLGLTFLGSLATYTVILIQFGSNVRVYEVIRNLYELQEQ